VAGLVYHHTSVLFSFPLTSYLLCFSFFLLLPIRSISMFRVMFAVDTPSGHHLISSSKNNILVTRWLGTSTTLLEIPPSDSQPLLRRNLTSRQHVFFFFFPTLIFISRSVVWSFLFLLFFLEFVASNDARGFFYFTENIIKGFVRRWH
jgi:hypothetical protein